MSRRAGRRALGIELAAVYVFLYLPITVLVVLSFNSSRIPTVWGGLSLEWYRTAFHDGPIIDSLRNTLTVAVAVTVLSTLLGTLLALGLQRTVKSRALDAVLFIPAVIPDIVLAIALLSFYSLAHTALGLQTIIISHVVFNMIFVAAIVRTRLSYFDPSIEQASADLYASPVKTFVLVTMPVILPGVIAGALIAFTLSVDEFVLAFFTSGPTSQTFPIRVYSMIRFGVTPEINAIAATVLAFSLVLIVIALRLTRARSRGTAAVLVA